MLLFLKSKQLLRERRLQYLKRLDIKSPILGDFIFYHCAELCSYLTKQLTINSDCMRVYCI